MYLQTYCQGKIMRYFASLSMTRHMALLKGGGATAISPPPGLIKVCHSERNEVKRRTELASSPKAIS